MSSFSQHHHTFFDTDNQPFSAAMLKELDSYLMSFPLRVAIPRQKLLWHLNRYSNLPKLSPNDTTEVMQAITQEYDCTDIKEIHEHLWTVELYCYLGIVGTQFTDLLNKIHYADYKRIDPKWFDHQVHGPLRRSYIEISWHVTLAVFS